MDNRLILVADGDKQICSLINFTLRTNNYKCIMANNGESAIVLTLSNNPSIVILELELPDMNGIEVIGKIRSFSDVPIVVVSSRGEDCIKVEALDAGADDYVTKPFSIEELLARLRVMERRYNKGKNERNISSMFYNGNLSIDYASNCVYVNGEEVHLTPIEYRILCMLSQNCGKVLTYTDITRKIWGNSWKSTVATLRTFVASIRKKIEKGKGIEYIHTHTNVGYRMVNMEF